MFGKIDFVPTSKLTFAFTGISSPTKVTGPTTALALETTSTTTSNDLRYPLKGGYAPSNQISGQATWLATPSLIINARLGRSYLNDKATNYDVPNSPLYQISGPCNSAISGGAPCPRVRLQNRSRTPPVTRRPYQYHHCKSFSLDATYTSASLDSSTA